MVNRDAAYQICSDINDQKDTAANLTNDMNIESNSTYTLEYRALYRLFNNSQTQKELDVCCMPFSIKNRTAGTMLRTHDWTTPYSGIVADLLKRGHAVTLLYGELDYTCEILGGYAVALGLQWDGRELKEQIQC